MMPAPGVVEWIGVGAALCGSALLALNVHGMSRFGWVFFLIADISWTAYGIWAGQWSLVVQNTGFILIGCVGLYRWFGSRPFVRRAGTRTRVPE